MMDDKWIKVFSDTFSPKAELVRIYLEDHGIKAFILNQQDSNYNNFGEINVMVHKENLIESLNLIKQLDE